MTDSPQCRYWVHFVGRVQGVGFRYTTRRVAAGFEVTGFVRNLADGRVELVAEGAPRELKAFCQAIQDAMSDYIQLVDVHELPATGEFFGFEIRH